MVDSPETPSAIIRNLIESHRMTEQQIVEELASLGVSISQASLNRIKTGVHQRTSFETGMGLVRLHKRVSKGNRSRAASGAPTSNAAA